MVLGFRPILQAVFTLWGSRSPQRQYQGLHGSRGHYPNLYLLPEKLQLGEHWHSQLWNCGIATLWNSMRTCGVTFVKTESCVYAAREWLVSPTRIFRRTSNHSSVAGLSDEIVAKFACKSQQESVPFVKWKWQGNSEKKSFLNCINSVS